MWWAKKITVKIKSTFSLSHRFHPRATVLFVCFIHLDLLIIYLCLTEGWILMWLTQSLNHLRKQQRSEWSPTSSRSRSRSNRQKASPMVSDATAIANLNFFVFQPVIHNNLEKQKWQSLETPVWPVFGLKHRDWFLVWSVKIEKPRNYDLNTHVFCATGSY